MFIDQAVLERHHGVSVAERRQLLDAWALYERVGLGARLDPVRLALIRSAARLHHPTTEHARPGMVKVSTDDGVLYVASLSGPCERMGCPVYLWDDQETGGVWVQHGESEESVRLFPRRFFLAPSFACSAERPDVLTWVSACHDYIEGREPVED